MNLEDLAKLVAISIGLPEDHPLEEAWEWDSLDHLSIVMNLQNRAGIDLNAMGDLSSTNTIAKLKQRIDEAGL